jgi:hypothetical protein
MVAFFEVEGLKLFSQASPHYFGAGELVPWVPWSMERMPATVAVKTGLAAATPPHQVANVYLVPDQRWSKLLQWGLAGIAVIFVLTEVGVVVQPLDWLRVD